MHEFFFPHKWAMIHLIQQILKPPFFSGDEDKTRVAYTLHYVLVAISMTVLVAALFSVLFAEQKLGGVVANLTVLGANLLAFRFLRWGKVHLSAIWLVTYSWILVTGYVFLTGSLNVASGLYLPVISMAALFLSWQASVATTVITLISSLILVTMSQFDYPLPILFPLEGTIGWVLFLFSLILTLIPLVSMRNELLKALRRAKNQLAERQKTEQALQQSEERFRMISSMMSDYTFFSRFNAEDKLENMLVIGAFQTITGYTPEEFAVIGGWPAIVHPDDLIQDERDMTALRSNQRIVSEMRILKKNHEIRHARVYAYPVWDAEKNKIIGINGAVRDITESKLAEETLRESEIRFRTLFETAPYMISVTRIDGLCLDVNPAWLKWGNWVAGDVVGKNLYHLMGVDRGVFDHFNQKLMRHGELNDEEMTVHRTDGEPRTLLFSARSFLYMNEQCILSNAIDVTEREQAEINIRGLNRDLQRQTKRLSMLNEINREIATLTLLEETLHNVLKKLMLVLPLDAFFVMLYDQSTHILSYPLLYDSARVWQAAPSIPEENTITWRVLESGMPLVVNQEPEETPSSQDETLGHPKRISASILSVPLILGEQVIGVVSAHSDQQNAYDEDHRELLTAVAYQIAISVHNSRLYENIQIELGERIHAEQKVRILNIDLEERVAERTQQHKAALQELQTFTYTVSHDLRAPLRAIDGFSNMLSQEYYQELPEKAQHYLGRVQANVQRMGELVDDLLMFVRIGRIELQPQSIDMNHMVEKIVEDFKTRGELKRVELSIQTLPPTEADPALLKQVVTNLISNAIKYSSQRSHPHIEIGVLWQDAEAVYFIRDNGIGFDMRYADKLFGVFQRLHNDDRYEGTGIGLAAVQRILAAHKGRVWAEAELDKGAAFFFTIPSGA